MLFCLVCAIILYRIGRIAMSEYDSILKEKKKKITVKEETKKFPKFAISLVLILVVLIVSYIIYFNSILSPLNIIVSDYEKIVDKYGVMTKNVLIEEFQKGNNLIGTIEYDNLIYDFNLLKDGENFNFNISNNDSYINYFLVNNNSFVKTNSITDYVSVAPLFTVNDFLLLKDNLSAISSDKYIKSFYFVEERPVVEINLTLDTKELNEIFGVYLQDDYEVIATFKNNAFTNDIEEIKFIINNKSKLDRRVITVDEDKILYVIDDVTYKIVLDYNNNDFMMKISKNDVLYSVFNGNVVEDGFVYTYQIIDTIYNISITSTKSGEEYLYKIVKKEDDLEKEVDISVKVGDRYVIDVVKTGLLDKDNGLISESFNNDINYFKDKFLEFVN